jgi:uroporphyrinogen-III synthase
MLLLVTRPEPDAVRTAAQLRALGHDVVVQPLLTMETLAAPDDVEDPAAIILTSRNGARTLASWKRSARWHSRPVFAVGAATAEAATTAGFTDVRSAEGDGVALAAMIIDTCDRGIGRLLYAAAEIRSTAMEEALDEAGFEVDIVTAYRMVAAKTLDPPVAKAVASGRCDGVLLYSRRSASVFLDLIAEAGLTPALRDLAVFVLSSAVAEPFGGIDVGRLVVAEAANEEAMMRAVGAAGGGSA